MELKRIDSACLKLLFLVEAGIIITQVLNLDSLTSVLFLTTFPLTVLLWIRSIRRTVSETDLIVVITCAAAGISVLINAAGASAHLSFGYLKKLIIFFMVLLYFQAAFRFRIDEKMHEYIRKVTDGIVVFLVLMFFLQTDRMYMLNGRRTVYFTFCFSNPNMTALFLSCLYMLKMHSLFEGGKWYVRLANILMQLILAGFIMETQSRNCLLVLMMYTAVSVWLIFRSQRKLRISKVWAAMIAAFPALLVAVYMTLVSSRWVQELLSFMISEGKGLDSRVRIWGLALRHLWESPVFGAYFEVSGGTGTFQLHNTHLDIAVSYGIPVCLLVCGLLIRYLHQRGRVYENKKRFIYILGFACAILLGMGEAAVFSGGLGINILAGALLLLANPAPQETKDG